MGVCYGRVRRNTEEREKLILKRGFKLISIWECEWKSLKNRIKPFLETLYFHKSPLIPEVRGGRCEVFRVHLKSDETQIIGFVDAVS